MKRFNIKVCGITRLEDAQHALSEGADFIGMILYPKSPRCVTQDQARYLCNALPAGKRVFVDVNTPVHELENFADLGFDRFQIHCDYETDLATIAGWSGVVGSENLWLAPKWPPGQPFPQMALEFCETMVLDTFSASAHGGTGKTGDWNRFAEAALLYQHKTLILAGGLNPDNIQEAIQASGTRFVDVNSGVESSPGIKNPAQISRLFSQIKALSIL